MGHSIRNVGKRFYFKGTEYQKIAVKDSDNCDNCYTVQDTELCYTAEDCEGIILQKYRSWVESFKQL